MMGTQVASWCLQVSAGGRGTCPTERQAGVGLYVVEFQAAAQGPRDLLQRAWLRVARRMRPGANPIALVPPRRVFQEFQSLFQGSIRPIQIPVRSGLLDLRARVAASRAGRLTGGLLPRLMPATRLQCARASAQQAGSERGRGGPGARDSSQCGIRSHSLIRGAPYI